MSFQTNMPPDQQHDPETGEVRDPISVRAVKNMPPRRHWDRVEGLVIRTADEGQQSQYELAFLAAQNEIAIVLETDAKAQISKERSYSYATLGQLLSHVRPILHKHGFTFKQGTGRIHKMGLDGGNQLYMPVYLKLTYVGTGESETYIGEMPLTKLDPQAVASVKTYGKRQLICDTFGIATADDDAISAMSARTMSKDDEAEMIAGTVEKFNSAKTIEELQKLGRQLRQSIQGLSEESYTKVTKAYQDRLDQLQDAPTEDKKRK